MITKIIAEELIQKAKKYVEKGDKFVIVTHVSPDGDALGASLGLYHFLNTYGKDQVTVIVPNDFPPFYRWMPGAKDSNRSVPAKSAQEPPALIFGLAFWT